MSRTSRTPRGHSSSTSIAGAWDDDLAELMEVPRALLAEVRSCAEVYAETDPSIFGRPIPIAAAAGDQQAATFGQACFAPGEAKVTLGTGAFLLANTGETPIASSHGLLTTIAWRLGPDAPLVYALEGSVFVTGAAVQWLRDGLGLFRESAEIERLAAAVADSGGVVVVPAFVGLGAPYWDPDARGAIFGLTRGSGTAQIARATLDAIALPGARRRRGDGRRSRVAAVRAAGRRRRRGRPRVRSRGRPTGPVDRATDGPRDDRVRGRGTGRFGGRVLGEPGRDRGHPPGRATLRAIGR